MLNCRLSKSHGAEIVGEDPEQVFRMLVEDGRKMGFVGKPDPPTQRKVDLDVLDDFSDEASLAQLKQDAEDELNHFVNFPLELADQTDSKLNTEHTVTNLGRRLLKSYREATSIYEETGVHVLFLALGALRWKEADHS